MWCDLTLCRWVRASWTTWSLFLQDIKNLLTLHNIAEVLNPQLCHCENLHSMYFQRVLFHLRFYLCKNGWTTHLQLSQLSAFCLEQSAARYLEATQSWHWLTENLAAVQNCHTRTIRLCIKVEKVKLSLCTLSRYMGSRGIAPLILNPSTSWRWVVSPSPLWIGGWVSLRAHLFRWRVILLVPARHQTPHHPACSPVSVVTELSQLQFVILC
jgi:hypothetical protein